MANIKSFPNNQDEYIGAECVMKWLHGRTSGVFAAENNAAVSAVQNEMAVNISDGLGWIANAGKDGVVWWIDNEAVDGTMLKLAIDAADSALNRIDRIVVEWKTTNYVDYPEIKVLKGNLASNAVAPALTNNSTVRQISLAKVSIAAGTTAITASMITDERMDASVCGLVTESISIDTSTIQNQFEELLEMIRIELQDLNEDTACLLKAGGTMYGALDMGDNKVSNVATPEDSADAANKQYVDDATKSMVLLWENASPTSAFSAQTVSLDLSEYQFVSIECKFKNSAQMRKMHFCAIDTTIGMDVVSTSGYVGVRTAVVSKTGIAFSSATYNGKDNNTSYIIPVRIYGIKGVVA